MATIRKFMKDCVESKKAPILFDLKGDELKELKQIRVFRRITSESGLAGETVIDLVFDEEHVLPVERLIKE